MSETLVHSRGPKFKGQFTKVTCYNDSRMDYLDVYIAVIASIGTGITMYIFLRDRPRVQVTVLPKPDCNERTLSIEVHVMNRTSRTIATRETGYRLYSGDRMKFAFINPPPQRLLPGVDYIIDAQLMRAKDDTDPRMIIKSVYIQDTNGKYHTGNLPKDIKAAFCP